MESTTLQVKGNLFSGTTSDWRGRTVVFCCKGSTCLPLVPVASVPLPPLQEHPTATPPQPGPQHQYHLLQNTVMQAVIKNRSAAPPHPHAPPPVCLRLVAPGQLFSKQASPPTSAPLPVVLNPTPAIGPLCFWPHKSINRHQLLLPAPLLPLHLPGGLTIRQYESESCSQCHQPRNEETGHSEYYGYIYCPQNTDKPLDHWMEEMQRKSAGKTWGAFPSTWFYEHFQFVHKKW